MPTLTALAEAVDVLDPTPEPEADQPATPQPLTPRELLTAFACIPFIYLILVGIMSLGGVE